MNSKPKGQTAAIMGLRKLQSEDDLKMPDRSNRVKGDKAKQTFFMDRRVHRKLKEICIEKNISQQDILTAGLDRYLKDYDGSSIEKITGQKPKYLLEDE